VPWVVLAGKTDRVKPVANFELDRMGTICRSQITRLSKPFWANSGSATKIFADPVRRTRKRGLPWDRGSAISVPIFQKTGIGTRFDGAGRAASNDRLHRAAATAGINERN
jgi:hypothetical protein